MVDGNRGKVAVDGEGQESRGRNPGGGVVGRRPRSRAGFCVRAALGADTAFGATAGDGRPAASGAGAGRLADGGVLAAGRLACLFLVPDVVV